MASSGKVTISKEDLRDGDGTLKRALELWSCRNGPASYNAWQSLYWGLIRDYGYHDEYLEEHPDVGPRERAEHVRSLWLEIQAKSILFWESLSSPPDPFQGAWATAKAKVFLDRFKFKIATYLDEPGT